MTIQPDYPTEPKQKPGGDSSIDGLERQRSPVSPARSTASTTKFETRSKPLSRSLIRREGCWPKSQHVKENPIPGARALLCGERRRRPKMTCGGVPGE